MASLLLRKVATRSQAPTPASSVTPAEPATTAPPIAGAVETIDEENQKRRKKSKTAASGSTILAQLGGSDTLG